MQYICTIIKYDAVRYSCVILSFKIYFSFSTYIHLNNNCSRLKKLNAIGGLSLVVLSLYCVAVCLLGFCEVCVEK